MRSRFLLFFFLLILLLTSCAPAPEPLATSVNPTQADVSPTQVEATIPPPSSPTAAATSAPVTAPKHKDLIFVEFFAVT